MGLSWNHANIKETADEVSFPIRYVARKNIGGGVPDQADSIMVSVTPRRTKLFQIKDGDVLKWSFGDLSSTAIVSGDTVTVEGLPLVSGAPFKALTFLRP